MYPLVYGLPVFPAGCLEDEFEVLADRAVHEKLEILKDHAELAAQEGYFFGFQCLEVVSADEGLAFFKAVFRSHGPDDRRLSGTDFSYDIDEIPAVDVDVHGVEDDAFAVHYVGVLEGYQ